MTQNQISFYDEFLRFCLILAQTLLSLEFFCGLFLGFIIGGAVIFWHKRHENDRLLNELKQKDNSYLSQLKQKDNAYLNELKQKDNSYLSQLKQKDNAYLKELECKNQEIQILRKRISALEIGASAKDYKLVPKNPI